MSRYIRRKKRESSTGDAGTTPSLDHSARMDLSIWAAEKFAGLSAALATGVVSANTARAVMPVVILLENHFIAQSSLRGKDKIVLRWRHRRAFVREVHSTTLAYSISYRCKADSSSFAAESNPERAIA